MKDADERVHIALAGVVKVAKDYFKIGFSQRAMFAAGNESEHGWRTAILGQICNRLLMGNVTENLRVLHTFLSGKKFSVIPLRAFQHVRTLKADPGEKPKFQSLMFAKGSRVDIPHMLPWQEGWRELTQGNRVILAED